MKQVELIEKRKTREKHFLREDGTILAEVYDTDIHYLKDGKYEEIDNTLVSENGILKNKSNDYKVEFKENFKESLMKMTKKNHYIDFKVRESNIGNIKSYKRKLSKQMKNTTYNNITDDITVEYQALSDKVKETIVLQNSNYSELSFELDTNLILSKENGEIIARDENEKIIFRIEKPYMRDSNKIRNDNVYYKINSFDYGYLLTLVLDEEWLNSNERVYPVYVDPTISNNSQNISLYDTYIYPGDTNDVRYIKPYLKAGVEKVNENLRPNRTLIKFSLPTIGTGSEIVYATLDLTSYPTNTQYPPERLATIHRVTADWDENTANWNNMNDKFEKRVESIFYGSRSTINGDVVIPKHSYYDGNITNLVKKWYRDTPNYGVMIKAVDESKYVDDDFPAFYSKDNNLPGDNNPKPIFSLVYRNHNGLENYLDYRQQSFTDGTAYINTYNGNLTTVFHLGHTVGGNLPVNLDLVYNTNDVILNNETFFSKGYRLNLEQVIKDVTIGNSNYLEYLDEDGTLHYFVKEENYDKYRDEDGLNLTIEKTDTICTMEDIDGNKMLFTKIDNIYRLTQITDIDNNSINITLNNNNSINKITDKFGYEVVITYNDDSILVTSPGTTTKLNFSNNLLLSLETLNGITTFEYNSNNIIINIIDCTGLKIMYDYYQYSPYRVFKVTQIGLNNTIGDYFTLDYGFESTSIIDNKDKTTTLIYNSYGNLLSQNSLSSEENIDSAYSINITYGNDENAKNRILTSESPIRHIKNFLKNASFEAETNYFQVSSNDSMISSTISTTECYSGTRSLEIVSQTEGQSVEQNVSVPKGDYYTFSGYFKNYDPIEISLSYFDKDGNNIISVQEIDYSNEFIRNDVTIFYDKDATSNLKIKIKVLSANTLYIDDVQLEVGEVANEFNVIENSDFSEGYSEWELDAWTYGDGAISPNSSFSIARFNNNKNTALKVSTDPSYGVKFTKTIPVKGKKGELFTCSFWYKNLGYPGCAPIAGSAVSIYFKPVGHDAEYCIATSDYFNPNENQWQFFSYRSHAPEDFECIKLVFLIGREANDFYLTNLSLYKNITSGEYQYDEMGNLISITDQSNNTNIFKYDKNNQLINSTNALGKDFKYEYDNNKKDRVLCAISSTGISNKIIYDSNGNPITTKISKKYKDEFNDGLYKIRCKGTNKYFKATLDMVLLEENECSNTIWKFEKIGDNYKIIYCLQPDYSISIRNGNVVLDKEDTNNLFEIEKNTDTLNGTYYIKYIEPAAEGGSWVKFLTENGVNLEAKIYSEITSNIEFYIELKEDLFIENDAIYTDDSRFIKKVTDSAFNEKTYNSNNINGLLDSVINQDNKKTEYIHNNKRQVTQIKYEDKIINYEYNDKNLVCKVSQNNKSFNLDYDNFLNVKNVKLNNSLNLITNEYGVSSNLLKTIYGNNDTISFEYDEFDRVSKIVKMDNIGSYKYDNNGHIAKINSNYNNFKYYYDISNRLYKFIDNTLTIDISYDSDNFITKKNYRLNKGKNGINHFLNINYVDELPMSVDIDSDKINYSYDNLDRVISKNINNLYNIQYKYKSYGKRTTDIIEEYIIDNNKFRYEYDSVGNITAIYYNSNLINSYEYDAYNELIKEINYELNNYIEYSYDAAGNMFKSVTKQLDTNVILDEHNYTYNNLVWEDQLTCFDDENIKYDSIGNSTKIGNNTLSWINGKELHKYVNSTSNQIIEYKYNIDGTRISKTINGIETKYFMDGTNIIFEETENSIIYYLYDLDGIIGLNYNNNTYYFVKNYQRDIIGIIDSSGEKIVSYYYDSWGNILSIKDNEDNEITDDNHIGIINPFRYRSYYYDKETNLYYLNTRYYNPKWGRFISPDTFIGSNQDMLSNNLYLYVSNNPINNIDDMGNILLGLIILGVGAALLKKSKKSKKKQTTKKAKGKNKTNSKVIPKVTVSSTKSKGANVASFAGRAAEIGYSKQAGVTATSTIYDSDSLFGIDFNIDPVNIFESSISFQLSTPIGTISKSVGFLSQSTRYEGNWKKTSEEKQRKVWESGNNFFSFYSQAGTDYFKNKDVYESNYDRLTVSKLVVAIAVVAPAFVKEIGKYQFIKVVAEAVA